MLDSAEIIRVGIIRYCERKTRAVNCRCRASIMQMRLEIAHEYANNVESVNDPEMKKQRYSDADATKEQYWRNDEAMMERR